MESFKYWHYQEVEEHFGLKQNPNLFLLADWLDSSGEITDTEQAQLEKLRLRLRKNALAWNEATLRDRFLSLLLELVDYEEDNYQPFSEILLGAELKSAKLGQLTVSGKVDYLLAKGEQIPRSPFFCLHEYKRERSSEGDPLGQLLIASLVAQQKNQEAGLDLPIYGAYIMGRNWYFVVLQGTEYAVSDVYAASKNEITKIFLILRKLKSIIQKILPDN